MKYRDLIQERYHSMDSASKYVIREMPSDEEVYYLVEFNDNDLDGIRSEMLNDKCRQCFFVGEDNFVYKLTSDTFVKTTGDFSFRYFDKQVKILERIAKEKHIIKNTVDQYEITQIVSKRSFSKYKKYRYIDKEYSTTFPFRFKRSKGGNAPLVIFFHGRGTAGTDNIIQMYDFIPVRKGLRHKDCNVVVPQMPVYKGSYDDKECNIAVFHAVKSLIDRLLLENNIDKQRVYIVGTSLGGAIVWQMLYQYSGYFACGVPAVGGLGFVVDNGISLENMRNENIWIVHAEDDTSSQIKYDDTCYEILKNMNANVKYTRSLKGGHSVCSSFYTKGEWADWMFEQRLKK